MNVVPKVGPPKKEDPDKPFKDTVEFRFLCSKEIESQVNIDFNQPFL